MKLRDKETGEIGRLEEINLDEGYYLVVIDGNPQTYRYYNTLKEITDKYEDYEEPEKFWYINECGNVLEYEYTGGCPGPIIEAEEIGNRFETQGAGEKVVKKLKALTKLENNGFKFEGWTIDDGLRVSICTNIDGEGIYNDDKKELRQNLDLLFGGEE